MGHIIPFKEPTSHPSHIYVVIHLDSREVEFLLYVDHITRVQILFEA